MNYAIRKPYPDGRKHTCGFATPDYSVQVAELTLYNAQQFLNLMVHGYIVEETEMDAGSYTEKEYSFFGGKALDQVALGLKPPRPVDERMRRAALSME